MDTKKKFIREICNDLKLFRLINGGGVPYSIIENNKGQEMYSCEKSREKGMIEHARSTHS